MVSTQRGAHTSSLQLSACLAPPRARIDHWPRTSASLPSSQVRAALHVCGDAGKEAFGGCAAGCVDLPGFDVLDHFDYSAALARALDAGVSVTFYYGKQDTACNYVGGLAMANESLAWGGAAAWATLPMKPLIVGGAPVGEVKAGAGPSHATLTFIAADGAGHMVPMDNGAAASLALSATISAAERMPGMMPGS